MWVTECWIEWEIKARSFIRSKWITNLQQLDWIMKEKWKYYIIEAKQKYLFKAPPFDWTWLDIKQIDLRIQLYNDLWIDTLLIVFEKNTNNVYYHSLQKLLKTKYFDTKKWVRIFNINDFKKEIFPQN